MIGDNRLSLGHVASLVMTPQYHAKLGEFQAFLATTKCQLNFP